jgi:hypothetical protein
MTFSALTYEGLVAAPSPAQQRLVAQYAGRRADFDIVVVGSGLGGGVLADRLAERLDRTRRILLLEAGSYLFPTHVYNVCRFPNAAVAARYDCTTFWQPGGPDDRHYLHERPQLAFGGRSIFWSGLIPMPQPWELEFFPQRVRADLAGGCLDEAGRTMHESVSLGRTARAIVEHLRAGPLAADFDIRETPRALHQPYLQRDGQPAERWFVEPTGVFNTAELLINQLGLAPGPADADGPGLHLLLNHYVEDLRSPGGGPFEIVARHTLDGEARFFHAPTVVLAGGSIESPKLLRRASLYGALPSSVRALVGRGLTDHPTTDWLAAHATSIGAVPITKQDHAKIVFYSCGRRDAAGRIVYPFNLEMNVNHEYWHLRDNDPDAPAGPGDSSSSLVELKFSFGNCLDDGNEVRAAAPYGYVPEVVFANLHWMDHLAAARLPALAGWTHGYEEIWATLNHVARLALAPFRDHGQPCRPVDGAWFGENFKDFGHGTVHHAVGTLRMPWRPRHDAPFLSESVVDEDLRVVGTQRLYACDMSVLPFSTAANPARALVALALRLARHLG